METTCQIEELPATPTLAVRFRAPAAELPQEFPRAYARVIAAMQRLGVMPAGPPYALYRDMNMSHPAVEAGFPVSAPQPGEGDVQASELPAGKVATCLHVGSYESIAETYERLTVWLQQQKLTVAGPMYECYLNSPEDTPEHALQTKIFIPVT